MILDKQTLYSDDQAVTVTAASTNLIDHSVAADQGKGVPMEILIQVTEDFGALTSLTVSLEVDDNASFSSVKTVATTGAVVLADLVAGKQFSLNHMPLGADERYSRLKYTVAGTTANAGTIVAGVTMGAQTNG